MNNYSQLWNAPDPGVAQETRDGMAAGTGMQLTLDSGEVFAGLKQDDLRMLRGLPDARYLMVKWACCLVDEDMPGEWLHHSLRALRPDGALMVLMLPSPGEDGIIAGGNLEVAWIITWLPRLKDWHLYLRPDGAYLLQGLKR